MQKEHNLINQRINLAPGAKNILENGPAKNGKGRDSAKFDFKYNEAVEFWKAHAQEAYELTAILSDMVVKHAIDISPDYPPYGLVKFDKGYENIEPETQITDLQELRRAFKNSLGISQYKVISDLHSKLEQKSKEPMVRIYGRYHDLFEFARNKLASSTDAIIDIGGGLNTASYVMNWTLENIIDVYERERPNEVISIEEFATIAENSWSYIAGRSAIHRHYFSMDSDPKDHTLIQTNRGLRLGYTEEAKRKIEKKGQKSKIMDRDLHASFGCPALVNFGDGSAIEKLWKLNIKAAKKVYELNSNGRPLGQWLINSEK